MVYCTKCGTKNKDELTICAKCGASLQGTLPERKYRAEGDCFGPRERREMEAGCFGLPYGGAIVGIVFGLIIVFLGLAIFLDWTNIWTYVWPFILVIVGILIIAGALYGMRRR